MKLKTKINLFFFSVLAVLSISIIATGYTIINQIIYDLYGKQFSRELKNINQEVMQTYQILENTGIIELESYVLEGQKDLLSKLENYHFGVTGVLYVLNNQGNILLKSKKTTVDIPIEKYLAKKESLQSSVLKTPNNHLSFSSKNEEYFSVFTLSPIWDWLIIIVINENEIFNLRNKYLYYVSLISFFIFFFVFLILVRFTNIMRIKINYILRYLQRMGAGQHSLRIPIHEQNELSEIETEINHMIAQIEEEIELRKASEAQLILAKEEAESANKAKSEFLSSMSHELRTPMNAILGFSQLIMADDELSEENKDCMEDIYHAGKHLLNLINDVLDLAKIESGSIQLSLEPIEVSQVIQECIQLILPIAKKNNIQINCLNCEQGIVLADHMKLKQIILNLLSNGIKYNRDNGSVNISAEIQNNNDLHILVNDTGKGIPKEHLSSLFQPFNRLGHENSNIEGTGIGLTLTRSIAEMMNGRVSVESEIGVGSTFKIELPLVR